MEYLPGETHLMLISTQKPEISRSELASAIGSLTDFFRDGEIDRLQPTGPAAVYTSSVTLWLLVLQRLASGSTLNEVVKDFIAHRPEFCPDNRRLDEGTLSESSGAYAGARKRIDLAAIKYLYHRVLDSFAVKPAPFQRRPRQTFLLDGTTITLAPNHELRNRYPPASNQHGETVWPIMLLLVAHDMRNGTAMLPEVGRMYGGKGDSEALLAARLLLRLPAESIVMADAGFRIFRVAYQCIQQKHDFLFRLTTQRFNSLIKKAELVQERWKKRVWKLSWRPTAKDRKGCPGICSDAVLDVTIHEVEIGDHGEKLYLVTSLSGDSESLAECYRSRYDVETDIKEIKVVLNTENIRAQSEEMVLKELYTSLIAYNLLIQFRRQAALRSRVEPRRLSFTEVLNTYNSFLKFDLSVRPAEECVERFEQALAMASRCKIPNRPGRRYKRAAHPRRPKTTKEQKAARKKGKPNDEEIPPET